MSCEYCNGTEYMYYAEDHGTIACVEVVHETLVVDLYRDYAEMPIKFCPVCGSPLSDPTPLTLEQLRGMDGEPVFTKTIGVVGSGRWELIVFDDHWLYCKTAHEDYKITLIEFKNTYGKTWLAYTHKPKDCGGDK